ncbi:hypothetical protein CMI37_38430 [Candidatus Pacearchaeota archaeon]|nr:hypothetical protein [Candidatus Pacearchaeota archaeon]|tara:strand:+ start:1399 stop:1845 length:447 start_codon:yes stop_codon:yes gene_type:complete
MESDFSDEKGVLGKKEETKFRELFKDIKCYILRIPDYASTGKRTKSPADFLVVKEGSSWMFEVKHTKSLTSLSFDSITDHQLVSLRQHHENGGGQSYLVIFNPDGVWFVNALSIIAYIKSTVRKSIPFWYIKSEGMYKNNFMEFFKHI